jgi:hypothetical protein
VSSRLADVVVVVILLAALGFELLTLERMPRHALRALFQDNAVYQGF